jgi:hypothetical protein
MIASFTDVLDKIGIGHGIGRRILFIVLVFSGVFALISTAFLLYTDFRRDINVIENRLDEIGRSYVESISAAVWHVNLDLLTLQMQGILRLPDVAGVEVLEENTATDLASPIIIKFGIPINNGPLTRKYDLTIMTAVILKT